MNQVGKAAAGDPGLLEPVDPEWGADLFYPQFRSCKTGRTRESYVSSVKALTTQTIPSPPDSQCWL